MNNHEGRALSDELRPSFYAEIAPYGAILI
jgi:hypothetical protein